MGTVKRAIKFALLLSIYAFSLVFVLAFGLWIIGAEAEAIEDIVAFCFLATLLVCWAIIADSVMDYFK